MTSIGLPAQFSVVALSTGYQEIAEKVSVQKVPLPELDTAGISLSILRSDSPHRFISGNKAWKLKYNLVEAKRRKANCLVTFGGAFSNHLLAVAAAAAESGFDAIGVVRGEEKPMNDILAQCRALGMQLVYVSREDYRDKEKVIQTLGLSTPLNYILPEGGTNALAVKGCAEIVPKNAAFDHVFVAVGTGGTLAGIAVGAATKMPAARVHGVVVLKGGDYLEKVVASLAPGLKNWKLETDFHEGGYAKTTPELLKFNARFCATTGIPAEPIYSGKMFFAISNMARQGRFDQGASILAIHTSGMI